MRKTARTKSGKKQKVSIPEDLEKLKESIPVFEESKVRTDCLGARKVTIEVGTR
jgi:hypothetical protein